MKTNLSSAIAAIFPETSLAKFNGVVEDAFSAAASMKATYEVVLERQERLMRLRQIQPINDQHRDSLLDEIKKAEKSLSRARAHSDATREPFQLRARLCDELHSFATDNWRLRDGRQFATAPIAPVYVNDPFAEVANLRAQLATVDAKVSEIDRAPLPADHLKNRIVDEVDKVAARGVPRISPRRREDDVVNFFDLLSVTGNERNRVPAGGAPFFVWLVRDLIIERLHGMVDSLDLSDALTDADREKALAVLPRQKLELERREEAIIIGAKGQDIDIPRRPDVNPYIFFEIAD